MQLEYKRGRSKLVWRILRVHKRIVISKQVGNGPIQRTETDYAKAAESTAAFRAAIVAKLAEGYVATDPALLARLKLPGVPKPTFTPPETDSPLVRDLIAAIAAYHAKCRYAPYQPVLGPPSSARQLSTLERRLGRPLPPSYRAFLELHNGWSSTDAGESFSEVLSVEDQGAGWVASRTEDLADLFEDQNLDNPFERGAIPVRLGQNERVWIALLPTKPRANGEMDFVEYDLCHEQGRFKTFTEIFERDLSVYRSLLRVKRTSSPAKKPRRRKR